ncbi:hypothetical protein M514_20982 [Trichuris suis]|uniref:Uncharacterized protein n=1 Tax=Trichuris suis TaxID=68888 RepID=A0A085NBJ2_9BILA|nr:hypothetical protein M514_20982 [Trichuris suis]
MKNLTRYNKSKQELEGTNTETAHRGRPPSLPPLVAMERALAASAVAERAAHCSGSLQTRIICKEPQLSIRRIKEAFYIQHNTTKDRDNGVEVSNIWNNLINITKTWESFQRRPQEEEKRKKKKRIEAPLPTLLTKNRDTTMDASDGKSRRRNTTRSQERNEDAKERDHGLLKTSPELSGDKPSPIVSGRTTKVHQDIGLTSGDQPISFQRQPPRIKLMH